ncbi:acetyl-CoA carboxylase biotin carboxyl carrier protein [Bacteroidota bacterium]
MNRLIAITEKKTRNHRILSPAVGTFYPAVENNSFVAANSIIGRLKILNSSFDIVLPGNFSGQIEIINGEDKCFFVDYKQDLFLLKPYINIDSEEIENVKTNELDQEFENGFLVRSFTTGIFYRRSSPDLPPYVEEGQLIEKGKALCLIEVMKTFNKVLFQGTAKSDSGKIKKILVEDCTEVNIGQPLFLLEDI